MHAFAQAHSGAVRALAFVACTVKEMSVDPNAVVLAQAQQQAAAAAAGNNGNYIINGNESMVSQLAAQATLMPSWLLASGSDDKLIQLFDVKYGNCVGTLQGHTGWILALHARPDGAYLASASSDRTVKIWAMDESGAGGALGLGGAGANGTGGLIGGGGSSGGGAGKGDRACVQTLTEHTDQVWCCRWNETGTMLATGSDDGTVCVYRVTK